MGRASAGLGRDFFDSSNFHDYRRIVESTVTTKNMTFTPVAIARQFSIEPGWKLDWQSGSKEGELLVKVIPDRGERARRLQGAGATLSPHRDAVAELIAEREADQ